jgi:hypothetical protein
MGRIRWEKIPDYAWRSNRSLTSHLRRTGHDPVLLGVSLALGDHLRVASEGARWIERDGFPSDQEWADEHESVLNFAAAHGQFERSLGRLRGTARQRDATFAEFRVAFFLARNGFNILQWEPNVTGRPGDLLVEWPGTEPIFVETKAPDWEGELSTDERATRKVSPKYVDGDGRWVDPVPNVLRVIRSNVLPKLGDYLPNMAIVHDDLFVSPTHRPSKWPKRFCDGMANPEFARLGAIYFVRPDRPLPGLGVDYATLFVENPNCLPACRIPTEVVTGLRRSERAGLRIY